MTKRRDVVARIAEAAGAAGIEWTLHREGASHSVYKLGGLTIPVPRHREIDANLTVKIYKECAAKLGKDWWR